MKSLRKEAKINNVSHMTIKRAKEFSNSIDKISEIVNIPAMKLLNIIHIPAKAFNQISKLPDKEILIIIKSLQEGKSLKEIMPKDKVIFQVELQKDIYQKLKEKGIIKNLPEILEQYVTKLG